MFYVAILLSCLVLLLCNVGAAVAAGGGEEASSCSKYEFPYELRANGKFYR